MYGISVQTSLPKPVMLATAVQFSLPKPVTVVQISQPIPAPPRVAQTTPLSSYNPVIVVKVVQTTFSYTKTTTIPDSTARTRYPRYPLIIPDKVPCLSIPAVWSQTSEDPPLLRSSHLRPDCTTRVARSNAPGVPPAVEALPLPTKTTVATVT